MPAFLECAHAYCTLGEQMDVLKTVYGEYVEIKDVAQLERLVREHLGGRGLS